MSTVHRILRGHSCSLRLEVCICAVRRREVECKTRTENVLIMARNITAKKWRDAKTTDMLVETRLNWNNTASAHSYVVTVTDTQRKTSKYKMTKNAETSSIIKSFQMLKRTQIS